MKIGELKPGIHATAKVNVTGRISSISETRTVTIQRTQQNARVADAVLEDESGKVKLTLWNEDIDLVKVNSTVTIENGYVTSFKGETQLSRGRFGQMTVA